MKISEVHVRGTNYCCDLYLKHKVSLIIDNANVHQALISILKSRKDKDKVCISDKAVVLVVTKSNWQKYVDRISRNRYKYLVIIENQELLYDKNFRIMINQSNKTKFMVLLNDKLGNMAKVRMYDYGIYELKENKLCYYNKKIA